MKIGFCTYDWSTSVPDANGAPTIGGAGWYRMQLPMRWLGDHGHEVRLGTLRYDNKQDIFVVCGWDDEVFEPDVMVMQRYMIRSIETCELMARASGQIVVNDMDDWFFGIDKRNNAAHQTSAERDSGMNRDHYAKILANSSAITVSTPFLRDQCRRMFPHTRVILLRNAIDLARWTPHEVRDESPVVGWVGALPYRSGDLSTDGAKETGWFVNANGLTFHHSGVVEPSEDYLAGHGTHDARRLAGQWFGTAGSQIGAERQSTRPMCSIDEYPAMFDPIDVGIVPLNDVPFNHAKSCIKAMEYAASGIPFVAQALPEQQWLRTEIGVGRTARARSDWNRELRRMLDVGWRKEQRDLNLAGIKGLDIDQCGSEWAEVYESLGA